MKSELHIIPHFFEQPHVKLLGYLQLIIINIMLISKLNYETHYRFEPPILS